MKSQNLIVYEAALNAAAFFVQPEAGYLRISGPDQAAFLQRQTTNDTQLLAPERALLSVLTSPNARILDVLYLLKEAESIGVMTLPGRGATTALFLKSRIFFMDKVSLEDLSGEITQIDLLGPQANEVLAQLGVDPIPQANQVVEFSMSGYPLRVLAMEPSFGLGYRLIVPSGAANQVQSALRDLQASSLDPEAYNILRVEAGIPAAGHELTEDYTPLEIGLQNVIADGKGCYTGQEVIARQVTYDKVTKLLKGLRLETEVNQGEHVWAEDRSVGSITSAVNSPRFGPIALTILKRPFYEPGTPVRVGSDMETGVTAVVVPVPFHEV